MGNYIQWIREQVGHEQIFLNFAAAFILNERGEVLSKKGKTCTPGGFLSRSDLFIPFHLSAGAESPKLSQFPNMST